ncbi:uncharacterized protein JCM6883_004499 [Sporobolomyces salmoneus]|uniref:uncharacterized protein n=1 Tax=Sporobolomyces salmoneus TaxID=183962 RepID=UPI003178F348
MSSPPNLPRASSHQLQSHKPKVPSRLSFSSLPPLPPLPSFDSLEAPTSSLRKRSPSPSPTPDRAPKRSRPTPRPRKSTSRGVSIENALASVGAVYIGWEDGKRDPAPLCCPVEKEKIKQRFGEAAIGWMSIPATQPQPPPPTTTLPYSILPPLPIPTSSVNTQTQQSDFLSAFSPSPPSLISYDSSSSSASSSFSPPTTSVYPFETSDSLSLFTSSASTASQTLALPPLSPITEQKHLDLDHVQEESMPSIKVEEDSCCFSGSEVMSESLWSSDEGGFWSTGYGGSSSGESEASWAW